MLLPAQHTADFLSNFRSDLLKGCTQPVHRSKRAPELLSISYLYNHAKTRIPRTKASAR